MTDTDGQFVSVRWTQTDATKEHNNTNHIELMGGGLKTNKTTINDDGQTNRKHSHTHTQNTHTDTLAGCVEW